MDTQAGQALLEQRRKEVVTTPQPLSKPKQTEPPCAPIVPSEPRPAADVCPLCRGLGWLRVPREIGDSPSDRLNEYVVCECSREEYERRRMERLQRISGLLESELQLTFNDVIQRNGKTGGMVKLAREFVGKPFGFCTFWGGVGNGKTLVLQAIVNEMRGRGVTGAYVRFYDLIEYVKAGFDDNADSSARERYRFLKDVPILAIDEVDKARMTAYANEFRAAFLDDRYRLAIAREAHTLFAMNADPATFPADIYDRLRDGRFVIFCNTDSSMRPVMEWQ